MEANGMMNGTHVVQLDHIDKDSKQDKRQLDKEEKEVSKEKEEEEEEDPWDVTYDVVTTTPWSELSTCRKVRRVLWDYITKPLLLVLFIYLFICTLDILGKAFTLLGGKTAGVVFKNSKLLSNPVAGLMIGVLATVLIQSSSTTTSIIISLVASDIMTVRAAIPMVMGANIGTSVTNTIVSLGQITSKTDFRRGFAGATVHDMFNWMAVLILLPIEVATGYLYYLSGAIVESLHLETNKGGKQQFLKKIVKPFTSLIIKVDKHVIEDVAHGRVDAQEKSMVKHFILGDVASTWSDTTIGAILLVFSILLLCICFAGLVKILHGMLRGRIALVVKKYINSDFPGRWAYFTGYIAILIGTGTTIIIQSSSVFTSSLTPLVGVGLLKLERMYPLTIGANIGTTMSAVMVACAQSKEDMPLSLQVAFCHLFFNVTGMLLLYPIPHTRVPIKLAKFLGNETAKYRWFAILYLVGMFVLLPAAVFGLSTVSWIATVAVFCPIILIVIIVLFIKLLQKKKPAILPKVLRNWKFLPVYCRSLRPIDNLFSKITELCPCRKKLHDQPIITEKTENTRL